MRCLKLPQELREPLGRGFVGVRICGHEDRVTSTLLELLSDCVRVVVVGDYVCSKLLDAKYIPSICIIDRLTRRGVAQQIDESYFSKILTCYNPRSHICQEAVEGVTEALRLADAGNRVLVIVDGEEDLLALIAIARSRPEWCVIYGLPGCGVELVFVDSDVKVTVRGILDLFEEVELTR